jgi:CRP/FNR family cyclic AMP-dependent transcriptional regulator
VLEDRLPTPLIEALARHGNARPFRPNTILITEGDAGDSLYIVLTGRLRAYASSEDGRDVVLGEYGPGEYVGELSLDGRPRSASVKTIEPSTCCVVSGRRAARLPRRASRLRPAHLAEAHSHGPPPHEQVKSLALQDVYGRMVRVLMELSDPGQGASAWCARSSPSRTSPTGSARRARWSTA